MINLIENSRFGMDSAECGANLPITSQEKFVNSVYLAVDEATAREMTRLQREEGIIPSCELGCCHCCRYHIVTNIAEAHTLAQYIKRELSVDQIDDLRLRTQQWHEWENSRPGRYPSVAIDMQTDLSDYEHGCPLLVDGECIAYPARPIVCRTHFVSSHPLFCHAANDPDSTEDAPTVLPSIPTATHPLSRALRDSIENACLDYSRAVMLLPHWLAIQMGWDFAIAM